MKTPAITILKWAAALFVLVFVVYQIYASLYAPLSTEAASYIESYDGLSVMTTVIRNEKIITSTAEGVRSYMIEEGGRIASGGVIARLYPSDEHAEARLQVSELDRRITVLKETQIYNDYRAADIELINSKILGGFIDLLNEGQSGKFSPDASVSDEFLRLLNRRQIVTGEAGDFSALIAELTAQRDSLDARFPESTQTIVSDVSGYFISSVDGCENFVSTDAFDSITPDMLKSLEVTKNEDRAVIGKVVSDYEWYLAATVPFEYTYEVQLGDVLTLKTGLPGCPELDVTVESINRQSMGGDAVLVFKCKIMNDELAVIRKQPMTIVKESYSGLRVSNKALRVVDGERGVFVLSGAQAVFKPVNVLYTGESYVVCEIRNDVSGSLKLYDEVIVKGRGLYDGKVVG